MSNLTKRKNLLVGSHQIKIDRKIAEGGYADIYRVTDGSKTPFALKRMFVETNADVLSRESNNNIAKAYFSELDILQEVQGCDNIVKLIDH